MNNEQLMQLEIINKYKQVAQNMLQHSFPDLNPSEINTAIEFSIVKRMQNGKAYLDNNYKDVKIETTLLEMAEYILKREPIITAHGVYFKKHGTEPNPLGKMVTGFMEARGIYKDEMFKYPKGSEDYEHYNLLQLLTKVDANAIYGALGMYSCTLYNIYVSPSITAQGQSLISTAGLYFESFLGSNFKFRSIDDIITFIDFVDKEKPIRKYKDSDILDRDITVSETFYKLMTNCAFEFMVMDDEREEGYKKTITGIEYIPTAEDMTIILDILYDLDQETINRLFYKNNLYSFIENKSMEKAITYLLKTLKTPMLDPNKAPKEIQIELDEFCNILEEYVYYDKIWIDKTERYRCATRVSNAHTDTDSVLTSFDGIYRCVLNMKSVEYTDMTIKHELINAIEFMECDEFGDVKELIPGITFEDDPIEYSFMDDAIIQMEKSINPIMIIPQESLRYSIINIFAYCVTQMINDYMRKYTQNSNSYDPSKKCLIIMKNEFLFKSMLLMPVKKNYATIQELQEGHVIKDARDGFDIKGMPINKTTLQKSTRDTLQNILFEEILNKVGEIDQVKILKRLALFEKQIFDNLNSGKKDYYKPLRIKAHTSYDDPMRNQGIKASVAYNALCDETAEKIDLTQRNSVDILKVNITPKNIAHLEQDNPEIYARIAQLMKQKEFNTGITAIAFLPDTFPEPWMYEFIDYNTIINDNICNFPIEEIGIFRGNAANNYTNIVSL